MSGSEPPGEARQPEKGPQLPPSQPTLVFEPDVRQAARVARVRRYTLVAAAILTFLALMLMVLYRPQVGTRPGAAPPPRPVPAAESVVRLAPPVTGRPAPVRHKVSAIDVARSAVAAIDTLVGRAYEEWLRAAALSPQGFVTRDNAEAAAGNLRKAVILADSARQGIARARQQAEVVRQTSRDAKSGIAFRLSVLYTAVDRYLKAVADDAKDRYEYYSRSEASVKAVMLGDGAESETQQNVANSYLRSSEERQSGIRRLAQQMREALRNTEDGGR